MVIVIYAEMWKLCALIHIEVRKMSCKFHKAIFHAVLAAALYAVSIPFSKLLLVEVPPTMLAAFLYIGAGIGMAVLGTVKKNRGEEPLQRRDIEYTISMVVLDIVAPVLLMLGLKFSLAANASFLITLRLWQLRSLHWRFLGRL